MTGSELTGPEVTGSKDHLKIGDFAKLAKTNLRTLRYYEELGLLEPAQRSEGGFRYYRPTDLHRVQVIHFLQDLGLALERIGEILDTRHRGEGRAEWVGRVRSALVEHQRLIDERIASLQGQRTQLDAALVKLALCGDCENTPSVDNNFCEPCQRTGDPLPDFLSALF